MRVTAIRSDIYARPDVYDMEYESADNHDARFFARWQSLLRGQHAMDEGDCDRSLTYCRCYALDIAAPNVAHGEHARQ